MGLDRDTVEFVETESTPTCLWVHDDSFSYQPKMGMAWLQRLCFWFLKRIGAYHASNWTTYRRVTVNRSASIAEIMRQQTNIAAEFGHGGELLLIGAEDWMTVMREEPLLFNPMAFDGEYYVPRPYEARRLLWEDRPRIEVDKIRRGMRVCVLPWMKGMVVVPREAIQPPALL